MCTLKPDWQNIVCLFQSDSRVLMIVGLLTIAGSHLLLGPCPLLDIPTESGYVQGTHLLICVSHYSIYPPSRGTYKELIYLFVYLTTRYTHRVGVRTRNSFTYLCISLLDIPTESGYVHLLICVSHYSIYPLSRGTYIYLFVYLTTRYTHWVGVRTFTYLCISLLDIPTESGYVHLLICVSHYSIYPLSRGTYIYLFVYLTTRYTQRVGVRTRNSFTYLCISLLDIPTESGYVQGTHYLFVYLTTRYTHRVGVRTRNTLPICVSHYSIYPPSRGTYKEHIYLFVYLTTRYTHRVGVRARNSFTYLCISLLDIPTESGYVQGTHLPICVSHYSIYLPSRGTYIYLFVYLTTRYTHRVGVRARNTFTYLCISLLDIPTESGYVHLPICVSHYSIYPPSRGTYKEHIYLFVFLTTRYTHRVGVRTFTYLCISLLIYPPNRGTYKEHIYLFVYLTTRYTHRVGVRTRNTFTY